MKTRNYEIDFWKFVFSICIVIYHAWQFQYTGDPIIFGYGNLLVEFFFVVSGYLMISKIYNKRKSQNIGKDTWKFLISKLKPIFPYILLAFIIGLILKSIYLDNDIHYLNNSIVEILQLQMFGLLNTSQMYLTVNTATWYISAMLFVFLVIYPIALKYKKTFTRIIAPISIFVLCFYITSNNIYIYDPLMITKFLPNGLFRAFLSINIGCATYELVLILRKIKFNTFSKILFTLLQVFLILLIFNIIQNGFLGLPILTIPFIFGLFILIMFSNLSYINKLFYSENWQLFSKFGFVMYLNHVYIRDILAKVEVVNYKYNLLRLICFGLIISVLSLLIIDVLSKFVEKNKDKIRKLFLIIR